MTLSATPSPWAEYSPSPFRPSIGGLVELCGEKYRALCRLAPGLAGLEGSFGSVSRGTLELRLEILEQTRYTTRLRLTYRFPSASGPGREPDALVRLYHDAAQAEVVELRQTALPLAHGFEAPSLVQKWRANLFLGRWLDHCLAQGHRFHAERRTQAAV